MARTEGGKNICGVSIGVLALESYFPKPPGHIKNPSGLDFTTTYETISGLTVPELLNNPDPKLARPLIDAARRLEDKGVKAITGSCGFLALFQKQIASAVDIPVFVSSLVQAPLIYVMTAKPIGVLTASSRLLTKQHFENVGAQNIPFVIEGLDDASEFSQVILRNERNDMDLEKVENELLTAGKRLVARDGNIGAILLECTDLPPYANRLQQILNKPIFDIITLARMVNSAVRQRPYDGFI